MMNEEKRKVIITTELIAYGKTFAIVKDCYGYWGIETKYIDDNRCIVEDVNGLRGHLNKELTDTIRQCKISALIDRLVEQGITKECAVNYAVGYIK